MDKYIFTVNPGSASKKYALFGEHQLLAHFEKNKKGFTGTLTLDHSPKKIKLSPKEYGSAVETFLSLAEARGIPKSEIEAVAVRVVAPGAFFQEDRVVGKLFRVNLKKVQSSAPLHITPLIEELKAIKKELPKTKIFGISDSNFHKTINKSERIIPLPKIKSSVKIEKYGYHGISAASVIKEMRIMSDDLPEKMILLHLGSGVSVTAIKHGKSVDTSMGMTPLEGPPMGTRSGSLDPGALLYFQKVKHLTPEKTEKILNEGSGLLGISGHTGDIRELLASHTDKDKLALEYFAHSIKKWLGAFRAELNGLDWLVLTGTAGTRSAPLRKLILGGLEDLGIKLDAEENRITEGLGFVNTLDSKVKILVIPNKEQEELAARAKAMLRK